MDQFGVISIIILCYILLLLLFKSMGIGKKKSCNNCNNCCPDCEAALNRVRRTQTDRILHHITLRIFDPRRYICNNCGWEGLRWEDKFRPGLD